MEIIDRENSEVRSDGQRVMDWFWTLLVAGIPLVGFIMLFVWAFGDNTRAEKSAWAKATLLWMLVAIGLALLIVLPLACVGLGTSLLDM